MKTMNKPTYNAIIQHSKNKPTLVFVSSRRQTRLTSKDLISFCANDENPYRFNKINPDDLQYLLKKVIDDTLKHTLIFGIGIHHVKKNINL